MYALIYVIYYIWSVGLIMSADHVGGFASGWVASPKSHMLDSQPAAEHKHNDTIHMLESQLWSSGALEHWHSGTIHMLGSLQ